MRILGSSLALYFFMFICLCDVSLGRYSVSVTRGRYGRNYRRWKRVRTWRQQADETPSIGIDATSSVAVLDLVDKECPRKPELIKNRKCFKKCKTEADCKGRNKSCLCDDVCGKSCVKPTKRCQTLKPVFNGQYEIVPFNTFGAKVRYTCTPGYVLAGSPERICQGDGYWSGDAPSCEAAGPTFISADHIPALAGKCRDPPVVPHATHDGPLAQKVFPLGTQLTYSCASGYNIDGFFRAMCVGEGRWVGPRMTCSPRRCPHPGDIPNGRREGNTFIFPNRVTYVCAEGYELIGRSYRVCQANGEWSGHTPTCKPVMCPRLKEPANGKMVGSDVTYGAVVRFSCFTGFQLKGTDNRRCQQDGSWSGMPTSCGMVDCGLPGPFYNGYLDGQQTTYGAVIVFRCFGRTTFDGESISTTCQENGKWTHTVPKCWSKCEVPKLDNGSVEGMQSGQYVKHGTQLTFNCKPGFQLNTSEDARCYNGTWTFQPMCAPSPCEDERPPYIADGMVRYHGVKHGDKAKYKCNTGYKLVGDHTMVCQYGQWIGEKPFCDPVYCEYPGTIENGRVLLVGVIGKYEYRPYAKSIGHTEQIEFQCNKGYKRVGPSAATCVDGVWSPPMLPYCVAGQHPNTLYIFRGKRSVDSEEPESLHKINDDHNNPGSHHDSPPAIDTDSKVKMSINEKNDGDTSDSGVDTNVHDTQIQQPDDDSKDSENIEHSNDDSNGDSSNEALNKNVDSNGNVEKNTEEITLTEAEVNSIQNDKKEARLEEFKQATNPQRHLEDVDEATDTPSSEYDNNQDVNNPSRDNDDTTNNGSNHVNQLSKDMHQTTEDNRKHDNNKTKTKMK